MRNIFFSIKISQYPRIPDVSNPVILLLFSSSIFLHAHQELRVLHVEEGPRGALRASQKHAGLLAFHPKRNVAAAG